MPIHSEYDSSVNLYAHVIEDASGADTDCIHLVLPNLNFGLSGELLSFDTVDVSLERAFTIYLTGSASRLNKAFQVFTRDIDPGQGLTTDVSNLLFRYVDPSAGDLLFSPFSTSIASSRDGPWNTVAPKPPATLVTGFIDLNADASYVTLGDDFVNYISYAIFNNTQGLDLLDNVRIVVDGTNTNADVALKEKIVTFAPVQASNNYDASNSVTSSDHPSEVILAQIEANKPERLDELKLVDPSGNNPANNNWYENFLIPGDVISFNASVRAATLQNLTTNSNANNDALEALTAGGPRTHIKDRKYTIHVTLEA